MKKSLGLVVLKVKKCIFLNIDYELFRVIDLKYDKKPPYSFEFFTFAIYNTPHCVGSTAVSAGHQSNSRSEYKKCEEIFSIESFYFITFFLPSTLFPRRDKKGLR